MSLTDAVEAYRTEQTPARHAACVFALASSTVFVCAPKDPALSVTGREPYFRIARTANRTVVICGGVDDVAPALFVFSTRAAADAWSSKVAGFAAEPIDGPGAAELAAQAGAGLCIDPDAAAVVVSHQAILFGQCAHRQLTNVDFAASVDAFIAGGGGTPPQTCRDAFRDAVFFILVAAPAQRSLWARLAGQTTKLPLAAGESLVPIGERNVLTRIEDGRPLIDASTSRMLVETWAHQEPHLACVAVDGPTLAEACVLANVDLGIRIGERKSIALGPDEMKAEWPRRDLAGASF